MMQRKCFPTLRARLTKAIRRNIKSIARLEHEFLRQRSTVACLSDWITDIVGSPVFVVAHLGELNHDQERRWQRTLVFHNRQGEAQQLRLFPEDCDPSLADDPDVVRIRLSKVGWTNARTFGDIYLARWLWRHLKLDDIVDRHLPSGKQTVRPADIVAIEVINRLCAPAASSPWPNTGMPRQAWKICLAWPMP